MIATLLEDIHSYGKGLRKYGSKGDRVKVISIHDEVYIVEGKERFSVHKSKIKINE